MCEARFYLTDDDDIININKIAYVYRSTRNDREYVGVCFSLLDDNDYINLYGAVGDAFWDFLIKEYQLKGD